MAKLTAPNGASVSVADDRVDGLLLRGFTKATGGESKAPAKKAAAPKKSASSDSE